MHRRWLVKKTNSEYVEYLSRNASVSPLCAQILINRGLKTASEVKDFLAPGTSQLSDPMEMQGMKEAVERIQSASKNGETIFIHGDFDADGITAAAIMVKILKRLGAHCHPFIPKRLEDGYGFNPPSVEKAVRAGASLIITVDCGITSFDAASLCRRNGIDLIITDHHEPEAKDGFPRSESVSDVKDFLLPEAVAIVNPKIDPGNSSLINLSGAGIAFKLAHGLANSRGLSFESSVHDLLDLAAVGTMADVVPLTGENRIMVKEGLGLLENNQNPGFQSLKQIAGIGRKRLKTGLVLFTLVPRINAAGRISDGANVLRLLLTDSGTEAEELSLWLNGINTERQRIEEEVYQEARSILPQKGDRSVIVLSGKEWNRGVIGIVASRIAEKFHRPVIILSIDGESARGSARSIPSFDMHEALSRNRDILIRFGGHKQAAGLEVETRNIGLLEERLLLTAAQLLEEDFKPVLNIDADVEFPHIDLRLIGELGMLEPFGLGNPEPILGSRGLEMLYPKIVKKNHLKMRLRQKNKSLDAIGFDMASIFERLAPFDAVDAAYTPSMNEWEGTRNVQLNLKGLRPGK